MFRTWVPLIGEAGPRLESPIKRKKHRGVLIDSLNDWSEVRARKLYPNISKHNVYTKRAMRRKWWVVTSGVSIPGNEPTWQSLTMPTPRRAIMAQPALQEDLVKVSRNHTRAKSNRMKKRLTLRMRNSSILQPILTLPRFKISRD